MKLYLVQYAKAASKHADPERLLTEDGRRDIQKIAAFIKPCRLRSWGPWSCFEIGFELALNWL
ncbi:MAG: hypothetical protein ACYTBX_12820 [Planctomycetota bacterium]|jgi:phosphohistidine phosphatase SixA